MKLYDHVERIKNELREIGLGNSVPLVASDLTPFDQYHYLGTQSVDDAARALGIGAQSRVIDIGSGIGGPARHLAVTTGCEVVAVELQSDLHDLAVYLTRRCALENQVKHICGDILAPLPLLGPFDCIVSFLCFLHIADHDRLFSVCRELLSEKGQMFIEDFFLRQEPTPEQSDALRIKVACSGLSDASTYLHELRRAGFVVGHFEDMTGRWTDFTVERLRSFRMARARNIDVHGVEVTDGLDDFYATVAGLFVDGVIGGARIHARMSGPPQTFGA